MKSNLSRHAAMDACPRRHPARRSAREGGFTILEIMIAASVLAIALLGHTASIFSEHKLSESQRARSTALLAAEQFMERLRSDDDWVGLYGRLNTLREIAILAGGGTAPDTLKSVPTQPWFDQAAVLSAYDFAKTDHAYLQDGRVVYAPQVYYSDFVRPSGLLSLHVLVDVPAAPLLSDPTGPPVLREDLPLTKFGLAADLDGDGAIDDASRNDDYQAIPIIVNVRWTHSNNSTEELRIASWLWGYR